MGCGRHAQLPLGHGLRHGRCHAGFLVDRDALADFGAALQKTTDRVEQAIYDAAGETFNINSPKQLGYILFEKLQLPHGKKLKEMVGHTPIEVVTGAALGIVLGFAMPMV